MKAKTDQKKTRRKKVKPNKKAIQQLILDAVQNPNVRSALYSKPRATAIKYGLTDQEGKALQTIRDSLLSSLDRHQVAALERIVEANANDEYGAPGPNCEPVNCGPAPVPCSPTCIPTKGCTPHPPVPNN